MGVITNLETPRNQWIRQLRYPSTEGDATSLPANSSSEPEPTDSSSAGDNKAVIPCYGNLTQLMFFGTNAANETCVCTIYEWQKQTHRKIAGYTAPADDYTAKKLLALTATLGAATGVSGGIVTDSEYYADTLVASGSYDTARTTIWSPTGDDRAHLTIDTYGATHLEVHFDVGTATSCGVLSRWL